VGRDSCHCGWNDGTCSGETMGQQIRYPGEWDVSMLPGHRRKYWIKFCL
jgi:hypothetical protein